MKPLLRNFSESNLVHSVVTNYHKTPTHHQDRFMSPVQKAPVPVVVNRQRRPGINII
jgi:hypothetical protein